MKFSQDGKKLACALTNMQEVQLYDFDKTTGLLSSQILLNDLCFGGYGHAGSGCYSEAMPYGLEFSPNGTYLYVSTMGNVTNQGLYQFDITGGTEQLIGQSRNVLEYISNQNSPYYGGIHLGDNGKLYVATYSSNNIGRINFPDHSWGTANGQDSIPIGGYAAAPLYPTSISGYCKLTFPSITKVYPEAVLTASISGPTSICSHDAITVTGSNGGNVPVEYHGWALEECTYTGATVVNGYSSGVLWDSLPLGTPFTFPGSNQLACNKYYKATYVIQNLTNCLTWVLSASKIIKVNCTPSTIVSDDTTICQGSCVILEGEIPFGGEVGIASTWVTSLPGSIMTSPTSNSIQVCPGSTATYTLTKKIKAGCSSWDAVTVTVVNPPVANFSYTVNTSNSSYNVITAVANDLSGSSANGFEEKWQVELLDASGNPISNTGDETVPNPPCWLTTLGTTNFPSYVGGNSVSCLNSNPGQFAKNQVYRITRYVRNANCDWQSYSPNITSPYRLLNHQSVNNGKKTDGAETLTIFPNPSKGLLNLNVENAVDKSYAVEIFDLFGKLVYKNGLTNTQGLQFKTDINLSGLNLPNGLYMVNLTTDTKTFSHRIIIEK